MIETEPMASPARNTDVNLSKFDKEHAAFERLKPQLLSDYRGQYVAIHEERVVGHGSDHFAVTMEAHRQFGHVAIYVDLVTDEIRRPVRIPRFRVLEKKNRVQGQPSIRPVFDADSGNV